MIEPTVRLMTLTEVEAELARLTEEAAARGWTVRNLKTAGDAWELDATDRGLLAEIRGMEFLANSGKHEHGDDE